MTDFFFFFKWPGFVQELSLLVVSAQYAKCFLHTSSVNPKMMKAILAAAEYHI